MGYVIDDTLRQYDVENDRAELNPAYLGRRKPVQRERYEYSAADRWRNKEREFAALKDRIRDRKGM